MVQSHFPLVQGSVREHNSYCVEHQIVNAPSITHGHIVPVIPVFPAKGLFADKVWKDISQQDGEQFEVVVYNSLTVDPKCKLQLYVA